jgi:hypothetical protein
MVAVPWLLILDLFIILLRVIGAIAFSHTILVILVVIALVFAIAGTPVVMARVR